MTEDQQPVWVESDGVSNLPTEKGVYKLRGSGKGSDADFGENFSYFNGTIFHCVYSNETVAVRSMNWEKETGWFEGGEVDAWWDYQGLMSKPQVKPIAQGGMPAETMVEEFGSAKFAVMDSDEPGIAAMQAKPVSEPEKVVVGGLTIDMADLVEFLKAKQPKPEPNTTPRGILTVWNEGADHRLGMWGHFE